MYSNFTDFSMLGAEMSYQGKLRDSIDNIILIRASYIEETGLC